MLHKCDFLPPLSDDELISLNRIAKSKKISANQPLFSIDEDDEYFVIVVDGIAKLTKALPDGRQQIVSLLFAQDFFARSSVERRSYFAEAASELEICYFRQKELDSLLGGLPNLQFNLIRQALNELDYAREWMLLLGQKTAEERVASFIVMASERCIQERKPVVAPPKNGVVFQLPLTRTDMADFLGISLETVSRQMSKLKSQDVIRVLDNRTICVVDLEQLAAVACLKQK